MTTEATETKAAATEVPSADLTKLTDGDIKWRAKYKVTKDELETERAQIAKERQELASKIDTTFKEKQTVEQRWIEAELKAQAIAAGIKDLDLVKLIDKSQIKVGQNGIEGLQQVIESFKTSKPDFFGADKKFSSSSNAPFPEETKTKPVSARDMSAEEFAKAKQQIYSGGRPY